MNLETRVDKRMWDAIRVSVENRNYTGAIQDAIYFLSDLIRTKSGLQGDGVSLIGNAFGGRNPVLKINKLQTESEKNFQAGVEQLLRGLYLGVRNPRSHEKIIDSEEDSIAIILFVNYLVKTIDQSKPPFLDRDFLARVFDSDFVPQVRYAQLLVEEIPQRKTVDIFYAVLDQIVKGVGDAEKLKIFLDELFVRIPEEELSSIYGEISNALQNASENAPIRMMLQIFFKIWPQLNESSRLRIEYKLIESIKDGKYDSIQGRCKSVALGSWITYIRSNMILKKELLYCIMNKLESSFYEEQEYTFRFFSSAIIELALEPTPRLISIIKKGIKDGDVRFRNLIVHEIPYFGAPLLDMFQDDLNAFVEREQDIDFSADDIPF